MDSAEGYRRLRMERRASRPRTSEGWIAAYVSFRRALGFNTGDTASTLRSLLAFMRKRGVASFGKVDRRLASAWLRSGSPQESTVGHRLKRAKGFFHYLVGLGALQKNVWECLSPPRLKRFIPHIYSLVEIQLVLGHVRDKIVRKPKWYRTYGAHHTMFHTLYACGLRVSEVCRLNVGDVDFKRSLFIVRNTKFGKTRLVPFNPRTHDLLAGYVEEFRPRDDSLAAGAPLFLNHQDRRFVGGKLARQHTKACAAVGIRRRREVKGNTVYGGTNVHALRHTFAVHRLLKWYYEGADVNSKLPRLATYMGHSSYLHTEHYLTILPMFIDIAGKLFSDRFEPPLIEIEKGLRCQEDS
jgi:site-specific recombinase XerD